VASTVMTMKLRHAGCQRAPDRHMLGRPPSVFEAGNFRNRRLLSAPTRRCRIADHPLSPLEDNALLGSRQHLAPTCSPRLISNNLDPSFNPWPICLKRATRSDSGIGCGSVLPQLYSTDPCRSSEHFHTSIRER
jgi:hypothetical protein